MSVAGKYVIENGDINGNIKPHRGRLSFTFIDIEIYSGLGFYQIGAGVKK